MRFSWRQLGGCGLLAIVGCATSPTAEVRQIRPHSVAAQSSSDAKAARRPGNEVQVAAAQSSQTAGEIHREAFGQTHHAELHGTDGTLTTVIDWDHVQEVRGLRAGETGPAPVLPIPDEYWRGARHSPVGDTYRDVFRRAETMTREWLSAAAAGRSCHPDLREGARVQVLLAAAIRSASSDGRMIPVNSGGGELSPLGDASGDPFTLG